MVSRRNMLAVAIAAAVAPKRALVKLFEPATVPTVNAGPWSDFPLVGTCGLTDAEHADAIRRAWRATRERAWAMGDEGTISPEKSRELCLELCRRAGAKIEADFRRIYGV